MSIIKHFGLLLHEIDSFDERVFVSESGSRPQWCKIIDGQFFYWYGIKIYLYEIKRKCA